MKAYCCACKSEFNEMDYTDRQRQKAIKHGYYFPLCADCDDTRAESAYLSDIAYSDQAV